MSVSTPAIYAVVILQVIVALPVVLLNTVTTSPALNIASGIVTLPPEPITTNLPKSVVANV